MCGGERPEDYKVPDLYQPDQEEVLWMQQEKLAILQYEQVIMLLIMSQAAGIGKTFCLHIKLCVSRRL